MAGNGEIGVIRIGMGNVANAVIGVGGFITLNPIVSEFDALDLIIPMPTAFEYFTVYFGSPRFTTAFNDSISELIEME